MAKDPAFLFYYDRFLSGTISMTDEEVGQYIRLMCIQANKGHITKKDMLHICRTHDNDVCKKFAPTPDGNFANTVLIEIMKQRQAFTESRRNNRKGKKSTNTSETHVKHVVNVNVNKDVSVEEKGVQGEKFSDEWFAEVFDDIYMGGVKMTFGHLDLKNEADIFRLRVRGSPKEYQDRDTGSIRNAFIYQLKNSNGKKNGIRNTDTKSIRRADAIIIPPTEGYGKF